MIIANENFSNMINSPVRKMAGRVELFKGSALELICGCHDSLKSFTIERVGEDGKFFGFGVCHRINAHLIDPQRTIEVSTENTLEVEYGVDSDYIYTYPNFYITEVNRDENTNELSITGYDALYRATEHTVSELDLLKAYTIKDFAIACATVLGIPVNLGSMADSSFNLYYEAGANFEGTENIREALNAVAEATQTIYYINNNWELTFKRLNKDGAAVATIDKAKYIELDSKTNRRITEIVSATELGDNISASTGATGSIQYIRNNPFWELREDITELVDNALATVNGLTINQFNCNWRGNYLLEIGDKIALVTKDNENVISYLLNDTTSFDGSLNQKSQWEYTDNEGETASNPSTLGEALKLTYARVDKINKEIEIVASDISANSEQISSLQMTTENISASVGNTESRIDDINNDISTLASKVSAAITAEDVTLAIQTELENGVNKVVTETGFTFNEDGLTVTKSGSEMETTITEDGMVVYKDNKEVLVADNEGVTAIDLKATTYLIIGDNSRFEDYGSSRTGCFWIG